MKKGSGIEQWVHHKPRRRVRVVSDGTAMGTQCRDAQTGDLIPDLIRLRPLTLDANVFTTWTAWMTCYDVQRTAPGAKGITTVSEMVELELGVGESQPRSDFPVRVFVKLGEEPRKWPVVDPDSGTGIGLVRQAQQGMIGDVQGMILDLEVNDLVSCAQHLARRIDDEQIRSALNGQEEHSS